MRRAGDPLIGLDLAQAADPAAPGPAEEARIMCDGVAGFIVLAIRRITGRPDLPVHVTLPHRGRARVGQYEDRLAAGVSLGGSGAMVLRFPARWLDVPNRLCGAPSVAGSGVHAGTGPWTGAVPGVDVLAPEAGEMGDGALLAALGRHFAPAAMAGRLSLGHAALSLGLAPRSLQRRLAALQTGFAAEADGWRRAEARRVLMTGGVGMQGLARRLGHGDGAHSIRAFRRWEGMTPGAWREMAMERTGAGGQGR